MSLKEELILKASGLHTYSDELSAVPEGSLRVGKNIVIDKNGLFSPRRGFETLPASTKPTSIDKLITATYDRFNYLLSHDAANDTLHRYNDDTDTWVPYTPSIAKPTNANSIKSVQANKNLYLTSNKGVQKLDSITGTLTDSGAPVGLDVSTAEVASGTAIPTNSVNATYSKSVGYRVIWGYKDANSNLILGAPSNRVIFSSTSATTVNVNVTTTIPTGITTAWFVQVYRTEVSESNSVSAIEPTDQMQLVAEQNPTAGEITAGEITVLDRTPDALLGSDLYTNATQQGALQANFQAPLSLDVALFQNYTFYANTENKYNTEFNILSVDGATSPTNLDSLNNGDTITIAGVAYIAKNVAAGGEVIASGYFLVAEGASSGDNIGDTAESLVRVINGYGSNSTVYATYQSGEGDLPGKIRIFERDYGDATAFEIDASAGDLAFRPDFSTATGSTLTAENDSKPNRVFFSKLQQPEAVPLLNFFNVGAANDEILRIILLRSILLIFTSAGVYKLTGTTANTFSVTLLDDTTTLLAPDSLVSFNNTAVGLFDQGIAQVTMTSVQILSRPIEGDLNVIRGATGDKLSELTFGIEYESDRKYLIGLPTSSTSTTADIFYVYNNITRSWTTFDLAYKAGIVRKEDDKIYLATGDTTIVERKDYGQSDFAEPALEFEATNRVGNIITLNSVVGILEGYQYFEDSSKFSTITSIDSATNKITVLDDLDFDFTRYKLPAVLDTNVVADDTVTVNSVVYTAKAASDHPNQEFKVGATIAESLTDLAQAINDHPSQVTIEAVVDTATDTITFQEATLAAAVAFTVSSSVGGNWTPDLSSPVASTEIDQDSEVRPYIVTEIEWNPIIAKSPNVLKQFSETTLLVNKPIQAATISFKTLTSGDFESVEIEDDSLGLWGLFPWGEVPWGGSTSVFRYRTWVPRSKQRDSALILKLEQNTIYNDFEISGWSVIYRNISQRVTR